MFQHILPYHPDSSQQFAGLLALPGAILLDSCQPASSQGRFDIITALPRQYWQAPATDEMTKHLNCFSHVDFMRQAEQALQSQPLPPRATELPFYWGLIGYLSYDYACFIHPLQPHHTPDIAIPSAHIALYDWSIIVDHKRQHTEWVSHLEPDHPTLQTIQALLGEKPKELGEFSLTQPFQSNLSASDYQQAFSQLHAHIQAGNCYQSNLAQRYTAHYQGNLLTAYHHLRQTSPAPYAAYMTLTNASLLSCSPERFIKIKQGVIETHPIKGTCARHPDPHQDQLARENLTHCEKNRAENLMIVDLMRNDLSQICLPHSIKVPALCQPHSFSNVHHLISTVEGKLKPSITPLQALTCCFPGGSITGAPKLAAMKIAQALEPHHRSIFCGTLFHCNAKAELDSQLCIRTLVTDNDQIHVYAGGGIVIDSIWEQEYAESNIKVNNIMACLS